MRASLVLAESRLEFTEELIALGKENSLFQIRSRSPSGKLPLLKDDSTLIWDSLAIAEYVAELAPERPLWPSKASERAMARSLCAEMHSSFLSLRTELPMNIRLRRNIDFLSNAARADISRVFEAWTDAFKGRSINTSPFLFGNFGIVDAFYAPVVLRFVSYGVEFPSELLLNYRDVILSHPSVKSWIHSAENEGLAIAKYDEHGL